jgi:hypothetical protein
MYELFESIKKINQSAQYDYRFIPESMLFNEGWMLRLVLDWFSQHQNLNHDLNFLENSTWFSEAQLPTFFTVVNTDDNESRTHADGIIGHFNIGDGNKVGLTLKNDAKQFVVIEAKMKSGLSESVTNAKKYNQAARTVGCMVEAIRIAKLQKHNFEKLAYYVIAPSLNSKIHIAQSEYIDIDHIKDSINYRSENIKNQDFLLDLPSIISLIKPKILKWEDIIEFIKSHDLVYGCQLLDFYVRANH